MAGFPTYAFDDSGKVIAFDGERAIADGTDFERVAAAANEYFDVVRQEHEHKATETERREATHITTPNGEEGTILGRTSTVFSDHITVRFANGQIRHYETFVGDGLTFSKQAAADAPKSPVEFFQRQLDEAIDPTRAGLTARIETLETIRKNATHLASQGVSYADGQALHQIVLTADAERNEVQEALDYLVAADGEAMTPPKQSYAAVEQADLGHAGDWLEVTAQQMVTESMAVDYDKLTAEGPTLLVSSLDNPVLASADTVREIAQNHIASRTAGFKGEAIEKYRESFVFDTELARRRESLYREQKTQETVQKEASAPEAPDEALFL